MGKATRRSRGFTLIASLLMLALLSGIALGLMFLVNGSARMGGNDMESNMAYYGAEAGMEKLTSDVPDPVPAENVAHTKRFRRSRLDFRPVQRAGGRNDLQRNRDAGLHHGNDDTQ